MSRTPEAFVNKTRKFFHDAFAYLSALLALLAVLAALAGGNYIGLGALSFVCFVIAANIKFKWVKRGEVGFYE